MENQEGQNTCVECGKPKESNADESEDMTLKYAVYKNIYHHFFL